MTTVLRPYITHWYNAELEYYIRDRYGGYLGTTPGASPGSHRFASIGQRRFEGPWELLGTHDSLTAAMAAAANAHGFHQAMWTKLEAWASSFAVPGAANQSILFCERAADDGTYDLRDRVVWLTEAIELWAGNLRVTDGGPFADVLVEGAVDQVEQNWIDYQAFGTPNIDPGTEVTEAMYDALSSFTETQLELLFIEEWHNRGTGGTWPDGDTVGAPA